MIKQAISKTTKLYDLMSEDYTKYPGNGDLSKKIVKCACIAHIKSGMNQSVVDFMNFLYQTNTHTFFNYESTDLVYEYIFVESKRQDDILNFLSIFSVELVMNDLDTLCFKNIINESIRKFVLDGINKISNKLEGCMDNSRMLHNKDHSSLIALLFILKNESFNFLYVLTENIK